jgi:hypothetical protein
MVSGRLCGELYRWQLLSGLGDEEINDIWEIGRIFPVGLINKKGPHFDDFTLAEQAWPPSCLLASIF